MGQTSSSALGFKTATCLEMQGTYFLHKRLDEDKIMIIVLSPPALTHALL